MTLEGLIQKDKVMIQKVLFWYGVIASINFAFWALAGLKATWDIYIIAPWRLGDTLQTLKIPLFVGKRRF